MTKGPAVVAVGPFVVSSRAVAHSIHHARSRSNGSTLNSSIGARSS